MWIPLLTTNISNSLSAAESNFFTSGNYSAGLADIVNFTMTHIRGKVQSWGPNQAALGPPTPQNPTGAYGSQVTIPDETMYAAIVLGRFRLLTILPAAGQLITKQRIEEKDEAHELLKDIAHGDMLIQGYPDGSFGTTAVGIPQRQANFDGQAFWLPYPSDMPPSSPIWQNSGSDLVY